MDLLSAKGKHECSDATKRLCSIWGAEQLWSWVTVGGISRAGFLRFPIFFSKNNLMHYFLSLYYIGFRFRNPWQKIIAYVRYIYTYILRIFISGIRVQIPLFRLFQFFYKVKWTRLIVIQHGLKTYFTKTCCIQILKKPSTLLTKLQQRL